MRKTAVVLGCAMLLAAMGASARIEKDIFFMHKDVLYRRDEPFKLYGIVTPNLLKPPVTMDTLIPAINHVAKCGANTLYVDLTGYSKDGTSISNQELTDLRTAIGQVKWHRLGLLCRVIGPGTPQDSAWRLRAAETAGKALRGLRTAMFLIDGPDSAALVKAFRKNAPQVVVVAPEGGDIQLVRGQAPANTTKPVLLIRDTITQIPNDTTYYILPAKKQSYATYDKLLRAPVELKPWTPDNSVLSPEERKEGFISLFDGKTFNGWMIEGDPSCWRIRNGMIEWVRHGGGVIRSRNRYRNFILRLDFKIAAGGNSGVFAHAPRYGRESKTGMEFQIHGDYGLAPTTTSTGAIYDVVAPPTNASKPSGEWNHMELMIDWPHYKSKLNGVPLLDINLNDHPELKYRLKEGFFGLQDHTSYVAFRNIRIKPLD